jgi:transporter family-2 protein
MLAFFTGMMLAVMVYFNGQMSQQTTVAFANLFFQLFGLLFFTVLLLVKKGRLPSGYRHWAFLLPGVLSSLTVLMSNIVVLKLGVAIMVGTSLLGQVTASMLIDQFGLLGKAKHPIKKSQFIGYLVITLGLILMVI